MKAKKSFGQHFLHNEMIAEKIASSLLLTNNYKQVLEVGPGKGMLTKYLLEKDYELTVVEADRDMVTYLKDYYPELLEHIIENDFLKLKLDKVFNHKAFGLIGNFPYNISTQIMFKVLDYHTLIPEVVGMFQKEVAERIAALPGSKKYGILSVLMRAYYDIQILFSVSKGNFNPPPNVQSAVIRLTHKENQELGCDFALLKRVVKQGFSQRRKMLRNTMKSFTKDKDFLELPILNQRPEQLSLENFIALTNEVAKYVAH